MKTLRGAPFVLVGTVIFHLFASVVVIEATSFCVPKNGIDDGRLQKNLDWACGQGIDCGPIQPGGVCADPPNVSSRATFAMNSYYRMKGSIPSACDFCGTGQITNTNPSHGHCKFI